MHKLAQRYESITYDRELQGFLALPPTPSITFAAIDASSSPARRLPRGIQEVVNAIVRFCDPCDVLGGIHGILEKHLGVKDAIDILRSSPSNTEALARAVNRLSLPEANARLKAIVGILQGYYESAREVNIFNELMGVPSPRSYDASRQTGSLIVVPRQQASVQE